MLFFHNKIMLGVRVKRKTLNTIINMGSIDIKSTNENI
jgi:hypothetical protein